MSFNMFPSRGPWIGDPRRLPRVNAEAADIVRSYSAAVADSSSSTFFTGALGSIDRIPGSATTNTAFTADTYKTLLSYTGSGLLCNIVSAAAAAADTFTFRVTLDGVAYTFTAVGGSNTERIVIGWGMPQDAYHAGTIYGFQNAAASTDGFTAKNNSSHDFVLLGPQDPRIPFLVAFERSILVEAKILGGSSANGLTEGHRAGVVMLANT